MAYEYDRDPADAEAVEQFTFLTPELADDQAKQNEAGWVFTLYHTTTREGKPTQILVRKINLVDRATLGNLPSTLQKRFVDLVNDRNERVDAGEQTITRERALENAGSRTEMANLYMCAGAVNPRVYMTLAEARQHGGVYVGNIHVTDRFAFMNACEGASRDAAGRFRPYRGQPADIVEARSTVKTVSEPVSIAERYPRDESAVADARLSGVDG